MYNKYSIEIAKRCFELREQGLKCEIIRQRLSLYGRSTVTRLAKKYKDHIGEKDGSNIVHVGHTKRA
jgi:hypothetical protein